MVSRAYPLLDKALQDACADLDYGGYANLPTDRRAAIARAAEQERNRIEIDEMQTTQPLTELGRDVKNQTDMPTVLIDRMVRQGATKTLNNFKGRGEPNRATTRRRSEIAPENQPVRRCDEAGNQD